MNKSIIQLLYFTNNFSYIVQLTEIKCYSQANLLMKSENTEK